jgi:L,D-transpeptidase ErfK/SrfK
VRTILLLLLLFLYLPVSGQYYEVSGSPYATNDAPLPQYIKRPAEKLILIDPREHVWGAYNPAGQLIRWGIATAGANRCSDTALSCRTKSGNFRIYSLGSSSCVSSKYDDAPMPYCMYFNGSEALHGAVDVVYGNKSHGCVRIHVDDAKWLRYHFVEGPTSANHYRGTRVIVRPY